MPSNWAARTKLTATELKEVLGKTVAENDRILLVEASAG